MVKTLYCLGDSNTWGYDPRGFWGDPYDHPWPELLGKALDCRCCNGGENGRTIPRSPAELALLKSSLLRSSPDLLLILLGTNDCLMGRSALQISQSMEALIRWLQARFPALPIHLLVPPSLRLPEPELQQTITALPELYRSLARRYGLGFTDLQALPLSLSCDGVHLTEEGHRLLSAVLASHLKNA